MLTLPSKPLVLVIKGMHVPSFKNCKRAILDRKNGKMRTLTDPKTRRQMDAIIQSFVSQSISDIQTRSAETLTGPFLQSSIVSLLPQNDSRQWIPEHHVSTQDVDKGNEGAEIIIERIEA
jgi:hypothetical protein